MIRQSFVHDRVIPLVLLETRSWHTIRYANGRMTKIDELLEEQLERMRELNERIAEIRRGVAETQQSIARDLETAPRGPLAVRDYRTHESHEYGIADGPARQRRPRATALRSPRHRR